MSKKMVLEEKNKELIIENDAGIDIERFKPEEKYPKLNDQEKCDYIVEIRNKNNSLFKILLVELKGSDFEKGVSQLENTFKHLKSEYTDCKHYCIYVGMGIPSTNSRLPKYKAKFKRLGTELIIKHKKCLMKTSLILKCKCGCI